MLFSRHLSGVTSMPTQSWTDETASGALALRCPGCGGVDELEPSVHRVSPEGVVRPIWSCPYACPLIEYVELANYGDDFVPGRYP